jgi:hypothetical protein
MHIHHQQLLVPGLQALVDSICKVHVFGVFIVAIVASLPPRSQLRLAAELLPHHITSLPQRLDYMIQLLAAEALGVVERCELAARLLLSLRGDLVPRTQQPCVGDSHWAFWKVQLWALPDDVDGEALSLQAQLAVFFKEFFTLAGQVR